MAFRKKPFRWWSRQKEQPLWLSFLRKESWLLPIPVLAWEGIYVCLLNYICSSNKFEIHFLDVLWVEYFNLFSDYEVNFLPLCVHIWYKWGAICSMDEFIHYFPFSFMLTCLPLPPSFVSYRVVIFAPFFLFNSIFVFEFFQHHNLWKKLLKSILTCLAQWLEVLLIASFGIETSVSR